MSPSPCLPKDAKNGYYFITLTVVDWLDVFTKPPYFELLKNALIHCIQNKGLVLYEYVFMANHIHLIVGTTGKNSLDSIVRDFKSFTTHEIKKLLLNDNRKYLPVLLGISPKLKRENKFQLWQRGNYPEEIVSSNFLETKAQYIWQNPVRKGYVAKPEEWLHSSAKQRLLELRLGHPEVVLPVADWEL